MSFASLSFLVFFLVVLTSTKIIESYLGRRAREVFLLFASYFFYGYWDARFCFLLLFVTIASYFTAKRTQNHLIYRIGIFIPLVVLGFFKYFNFFLDSFAAVSGLELGTLKIILPVGISFYTFQALSYVIDVHRGKIDVENDFIKLALYISFFPQLVAGPIVRAIDFLPQLKENRTINAENIKYGIQLFAFGLFKKLVLADHVSVFVDDIYNTPAAFHWATLLLAIVSYSIQIYLDFSGYSDMAIGSAKCFGYNFNRNFNLPYLSQNVTEFWRRWHISLSTWLKEYLYIPLGGNRKGKARQHLNIFLTMLLGGLWHGAGWTYVFWGALNGLALCLHKLMPKREKSLVEKLICIALTFSFVTVTLVFFRAKTFTDAITVLRGIYTLQPGVQQPFFWSFVALFLFLICNIAAIVKGKTSDFTKINGYYPIVDLSTIKGLTCFFVFIGLILGLAYTGENPFVYFQF